MVSVEDLIHAFWRRKSLKGHKCSYHFYYHYRDEVKAVDGKVRYYMHEYPIAIWDTRKNILTIDDHGYPTYTTYNRLNNILSDIRYGAFRLSMKWSFIGIIYSYNKVENNYYEPPVTIDLESGKVIEYGYIIPAEYFNDFISTAKYLTKKYYTCYNEIKFGKLPKKIRKKTVDKIAPVLMINFINNSNPFLFFTHDY